MVAVATHLLYLAHFGELPPTGSEICWLCGQPCPPPSPDDPISRWAQDVVRSTFNDHAKARRGGESEVCCHACAWYFDYKIMRDGGKRAMGFFTKTIIVFSDHWREWDREEMADDLLRWHRDGVPDDCVLTINYSKQKHVVPWARVNPAGTRRPWIATDNGEFRLPDALPAMVAAVADLWGRGYGKTQLGRAELSPFILAKSVDPAGDLAVCRVLEPHANTLALEMATYIVTEANRERLARELAALLPRTEPLPATGGGAADHPERGGGSRVQAEVSPAVVGDARGAREAVRDDIERPDPLEQLALF